MSAGAPNWLPEPAFSGSIAPIGAQPVPKTPPKGPPPGSELPQIIVGGRELREESADCHAALQVANDPPEVFIHSGRMFESVVDEKGRRIGREVTEAALRGRLTRIADFRKKTAKGLMPCFPPRDVVEDLLAQAPGALGFPVLKGIVSTPVLRDDGNVLTEPGYDPLSELYYSPLPGFRLPDIAESPSSDHIDVAVGLLDEMFDGFPFADQSSRANAFAGLFTPVLRPVIEGPTPALIASAPMAGTGKSLLAELIALLATGESAQMVSMPRDEAEMQKILTTLIESRTDVAVFDNVTKRVDNPDLAKAITETFHSDREFRTHQKRVSPVRCTWVITGNNVRIGGDLPRRCYWVVLDAKTSRPELRSDFKIADLKAWVIARRPELLAALFTLARAWYVAGKPAPHQRPLGSFESWSTTIGGILERAGISGFLGNASELREVADMEAGQWERFLQLLREIFCDRSFGVADLGEKMRERGDLFDGSGELSPEAKEVRRALPDYLAEVANQDGFFRRRAGKLFAENADRRFGESQIYLQRDGISHHAQMWKVSAGS